MAYLISGSVILDQSRNLVDALDITGTRNLNVDTGISTVNILNVLSYADVTGDLTVQGFQASGISTFLGNVTIGDSIADTLTILADVTINNNVAITSNLSVSGTTTLEDLVVNGTSTIGGSSLGDDISTRNLLISGIATFQGDVNIGNAVTDNLTVLSSTTFNNNVAISSNLTVNGNTILGDAASDTLIVNATSTFNNFVTIDDDLNVTGIATIATLGLGAGVLVSSILDEDTMASNSDTALATQQSIKAYVDTQVGAANQLTFTDGTTIGEVELATETLELLGTANEVTVVVTSAAGVGNTVTFGLPDDVTITGDLIVGQNFSVASGIATIQDLDVTGTATIATLGLGAGVLVTSILDEDNLGSNSDTALATQQSIKAYIDTQVGNANQLFFTDGTTTGEIELAFETLSLLGTANEIVVEVTSAAGAGNTVTFGLPDDVTITGHLTVGDGASVTGIVTATDFNSTSDINKKENIEVIPDAVAKVNALRGVLFDWKDGSGHSGGVIAQEVEAVLPSLVKESDHKTVVYNGIIGLLVEAVKELSAEVEALKAHHN